MKKSLSILLALFMLATSISTLTLTASAATYDEILEVYKGTFEFTDKSIVAVGKHLDGKLELNDDTLAISNGSNAVKWSDGTNTYGNSYIKKAEAHKTYTVTYDITSKYNAARFGKLDDVKVNGVSCDWTTYDDGLGLRVTVKYIYVGLDNCKAENGNNYYIPGATYSFIPNEVPDGAKYHRVWEYYDYRDDSNVYKTETTADLSKKFSVKILNQTDDRIRGNAVEHTIVTDKAVAATETKTGLTEGKHCSACGTVLVEQKTTPVLAKTADNKPTTPKTTVVKKTLKTPKVKFIAGKKQFKVKYTKVKNAVGFQVKYKIGKKTVTKNFNSKKSVVKAIKKLKKGKYKVQIRAFSKGKISFSDWTKVKTVKVK